MAKGDEPTISLEVRSGTLVPVTSFDQEVIGTYKNGARLECLLHQPKDPVGMRRLHATINTAIKQCNTPWKTITQAKDSMKVSLGFTTYGVTIDGKPFLAPLPMKEFDERDRQEFEEGCYALLQQITGVDPTTLRNESADPGPDEKSTYVEPDTSEEESVELLRELTLIIVPAAGPDASILQAQASAFKESHTDRMRAKHRDSAIKIYEQLKSLCGEKPQGDRKTVITYISGLSGLEEKKIEEVINI